MASQVLTAAPIDPVPAPHRFASIEAWLRAWIAWRLAREEGTSRMRCAGPFGDGLVLGGTIGLLYAFAGDGAVWILQEGIGQEADAWREATPNQRFAILVDAQRRVYPELAVLLPLRPHDAVDCAACEGRVYDMAWCGACSNRGWTLAGVDTTLTPLFQYTDPAGTSR
jgi:hypothetical protein